MSVEFLTAPPSSGVAATMAPSSAIARAGDYVWLAGQVARDADGAVVGVGDLVAQAAQVFDNTGRLLRSIGGDFSSIVKLTTYFTQPLNLDMANAYWDVRGSFLGDHKPVSTGVQVAGLLHPDFLLEMDVVAYVPRDAR